MRGSLFIRSLGSLSLCQAWTVYQVSLGNPALALRPFSPAWEGWASYTDLMALPGVGCSLPQKIMQIRYQQGEGMKAQDVLQNSDLSPSAGRIYTFSTL